MNMSLNMDFEFVIFTTHVAKRAIIPVQLSGSSPPLSSVMRPEQDNFSTAFITHSITTF